MTQVIIKDNYFEVTEDTNTGKLDFDILSFKFVNFNRWLLRQPSSYLLHSVTQLEEGMLDLISYQYYGTEAYWWIIAVANNLLDPVTEVTFGKSLIIPTKNAVSAYIATLTETTQQVIEL